MEAEAYLPHLCRSLASTPANTLERPLSLAYEHLAPAKRVQVDRQRQHGEDC